MFVSTSISSSTTLTQSALKLVTKEDDSQTDILLTLCTNLIEELNEAGLTVTDAYLDVMLMLHNCTTFPKLNATK